jgi:hypothetical protein
MAGMLRDMIQREDLSDRVTMLGAVPTQDVRNVLVRGCHVVRQKYREWLTLELMTESCSCIPALQCYRSHGRQQLDAA